MNSHPTLDVLLICAFLLLAGCSSDPDTAPAAGGTVPVFDPGCDTTEDCIGGVCVTVLGIKACAPACDGVGASATCAAELIGACLADGQGAFGCGPTCDDGACPGGWTCVDLGQETVCAPPGANAETCTSGLTRCDGQCVGTQDNPAHCGGCGNQCPNGAECVSGQCECPQAAPVQCGDQCVNTQTDEVHCGLCDTPCALTNASAACNAGQCTLVACDPGFLSCDGDQSNGCEIAASAVPTAAITVQEGTPVNELTDLHLSGSDSTGPNPIAAYQWAVSAPEGSLGELLPNSTSEAVVWSTADLVGVYSFGLAVTDDTGAENCQTAASVIIAEPRGQLHIELSWAEGGNLDLHLIREDADLFDPVLDAWTDNPNPDWDDVNDDGDDPELQRAMAEGPANEILSMGLPKEDLTYRVAVHYNGDGAPAVVRVRVFVEGTLAYSKTDITLSPKDLWHVGSQPTDSAFVAALSDVGDPIIEPGVSTP
ncbi:MAG: hypothetical protein ACI9WU_004742 [Myxococcota bacterium]|jgi:hypothetical protein